MKLPDKMRWNGEEVPVDGALERLLKAEKKPEPVVEQPAKESIVEKKLLCGDIDNASWEATCNGIIILREGKFYLCDSSGKTTMLYEPREQVEDWRGGLGGVVIERKTRDILTRLKTKYYLYSPDGTSRLVGVMPGARFSVVKDPWYPYKDGVLVGQLDEDGMQVVTYLTGKRKPEKIETYPNCAPWKAGCISKFVEAGFELRYDNLKGPVFYDRPQRKWGIGLGGVVVQNDDTLTLHRLGKEEVELYKGPLHRWCPECLGVAVQPNEDEIYWVRTKPEHWDQALLGHIK